MLAVGAVVYDTPLPEQWSGYLLAFVLALASTVSLGAALAAIAPTAKAAGAISTCVFFPSMFTAGLWIPVQAMPDLLRRIVEFTPMGASADALNTATLGSMPELVDVAVVSGWAVIFVALAVRFFKWE